MKKKVFRSGMCLILTICMILGTAISAQAAGESAQPYYTGISSFTTSLSFTEGTAHCYSSASASRANTTVRLTMSLQRSENQSSWTTVYTSFVEGTAPSMDRDVSVSHGYYYRLFCTTRVYNSSNSLIGSNDRYSSVKYY